jgi:hypothetical protein
MASQVDKVEYGVLIRSHQIGCLGRLIFCVLHLCFTDDPLTLPLHVVHHFCVWRSGGRKTYRVTRLSRYSICSIDKCTTYDNSDET